MSQTPTQYAVRRTDGRYLLLIKTVGSVIHQTATWTSDLNLATRFPFMTSANLTMGLDQDPCLQVERDGWDVVAVPAAPTAHAYHFSVPMVAVLLCVFALVASPVQAQVPAPIYSAWVNACLALHPPVAEEYDAARVRQCLESEPQPRRFAWMPLIAAAAGQLADTAVTVHQINTPALHCSEANPLFGAHPSTMKLLLPKLAVIAGVGLVQIAGKHAQGKAGRWVAKSAGYFAGALGGTFAYRNLRTCGF